MLDHSPFADFEHASRAVLEILYQRLGFNLWMVTRTEGDNWIVLQANDHGYNVKDGDVFRWADSFCSQMVLGRGPCMAPSSELVPTYADAPIGRLVKIRAYVGIPLNREDGTLFGTMCAIHPDPRPASIVEDLPFVNLLGRLLSTVLAQELKTSNLNRQAEHLRAEIMKDHLTGLYNRRGWEILTAAEEGRCTRYGHSACVVVIDLDEFKLINDTHGHARGDEILKQTAKAISGVVRSPDFVARLGGDEFAVLGVECDSFGSLALRSRIEAALATAKIKASVGVAVREPCKRIHDTLHEADKAMLATKVSRRHLPAHGVEAMLI